MTTTNRPCAVTRRRQELLEADIADLLADARCAERDAQEPDRRDAEELLAYAAECRRRAARLEGSAHAEVPHAAS